MLDDFALSSSAGKFPLFLIRRASIFIGLQVHQEQILLSAIKCNRVRDIKYKNLCAQALVQLEVM
jgi:hypothetical protein